MVKAFKLSPDGRDGCRPLLFFRFHSEGKEIGLNRKYYIRRLSEEADDRMEAFCGFDAMGI